MITPLFRGARDRALFSEAERAKKRDDVAREGVDSETNPSENLDARLTVSINERLHSSQLETKVAKIVF